MKNGNAIYKAIFDFNIFLNTLANLKLIEKPNIPSLLKVRKADKYLAELTNKVLGTNLDQATVHNVLADMWTF